MRSVATSSNWTSCHGVNISLRKWSCHGASSSRPFSLRTRTSHSEMASITWSGPWPNEDTCILIYTVSKKYTPTGWAQNGATPLWPIAYNFLNTAQIYTIFAQWRNQTRCYYVIVILCEFCSVIKRHELYCRASFEIMTHIRQVAPLLYIINFSIIFSCKEWNDFDFCKKSCRSEQHFWSYKLYKRVAPFFAHPVLLRKSS